MATWRQQTSAECQSDFDDLLDVGIEIAAERLSANWGLDPVAVVNDRDGGRRVVSAAQTESDQYSASDTPIRDRLIDGLRAEETRVRSFAIVSAVQVVGTSDTQLEILLEHREYALQILLAYDMPDPETFDLGPMKAAKGTSLVWN
ncbi:hypothetical protein BJD99_00180 [Rhodococcus sp. 1163]|uniref:hypothetical protein n=1 Tax=Rhodococcus sp. 1163 TaxID=1905289 RepID=UPI0009FC77CE|nr:hypothetical protein [Rhodococcus sp. 1163]ORI13119.1 hypothetical protein BJD99_00180 [Rhodococcus sp. 1163]